MDENTPASRGSVAPVIAVLLAVALVGAAVYIGSLRGQLTAAQQQLAPFAKIAKTLYPDADPATALRSVAQRIEPLAARANSLQQQAAAAAAAPAAPPPADAPAPPPADFLTAQQEEAMVGVLRNETDSGRKAWFLVAQNNREAAAAQAELQQIFEKAGWPVAIERAPYTVKAGIFMLAGDETPPHFVDTVSDAFDAGGVELQYLTGYRDFYKGRQAENPKWVGPTLADDQPFTIVIGSKPQPKVAE
ncbi:hypothetical protein KF840_03825 [bacterium]|nr:hypothetical protein [bacterium]